MTVNRERVELWIAALESGEYEQCRETLRSENNQFCALGVAIDVAIKNNVVIKDEVPVNWEQKFPGILPNLVVRWYGFEVAFIGVFDLPNDPVIPVGDDLFTISEANDKLHMSFWDIAQALRAKYLKDEE